MIVYNLFLSLPSRWRDKINKRKCQKLIYINKNKGCRDVYYYENYQEILKFI